MMLRFSSIKSFLGRFIPVTGMAVLAVGLWMILGALKNGHYDPRAVGAPSSIRPIPEFKGKPLFLDQQSFDSDILKQQEKPVLVVFFASWCVECVAEMPVLKNFQDIVPLWGVDYDDKTAKGQAFVTKSGISFERLNQDQDGLIGANWGLTGVPESFLIMPGGKIAFHADGPLDMQDLELHILPLLQHTKNLPAPPVFQDKTALFPHS